ncbi:MAG: alpha/beta hydrolase [Burkholderiales bacterium]|nr:MAG: alpha/beta hydrolase [Burkholderiales bacterium]
MKIKLTPTESISAIVDTPPAPRACLVLAHGAGAGMHHEFMAAMALGLKARGIATLRFQFPFMEKGSRRPDTPAVAHAAVRAAVAAAAKRFPRLPLFAGGKSFGGRMTTQAQAIDVLPGVEGLVLLGFPLHPPKKPSLDRAAHLEAVKVPMLFLQGTRDELADLALVKQVTSALGRRAKLHVVDAADHGFDVLVRSGRTRLEVREELLDTMARWMTRRSVRAKAVPLKKKSPNR